MNEVNSRDAKDRWKLGAVVAFAIALAGLGTIIASNLAPTPVLIDPVAAPNTTTTSRETATTPASLVTVATRASGQSSTSLPTAPAMLELSDTVFDFGDTDTTLGFEITNNGGTATSWAIHSSDPSVVASPADGGIGPGEVVEGSVSLDRTLVSEGELDAILTLEWGGEEQQIFIRGAHADNPIIIGPKATPSTVFSQGLSTCSPAKSTITVRVRDTSDIAEVLVRWSSGGNSVTVETPMELVDVESYTAVIGPFTTIASPNVKIVATDIHDNAGGAAVALTVLACPQ